MDSLQLIATPEAVLVPLDDLAKAANHRPCTDEEYNTQRRCWTCGYYSFKSYSDDDHNRGKCFGMGPERVWYTAGMDVCDNFKPDGG